MKAIRQQKKLEIKRQAVLRGDTTSRKSTIIAIMLCLCAAVGFGGMHYFYVGKIKMGLLHFVTVGFAWVGALVDLVRLLRGTFTDDLGMTLAKPDYAKMIGKFKKTEKASL